MEYIGTIEEDYISADIKQILIYGAGKVGRHAFDNLCQRGYGTSVIGFCDNNRMLIGKTLYDRPIFSLDVASQKYPDATYFVASMCVRQMIDSLKAAGIGKIHIIRESD